MNLKLFKVTAIGAALLAGGCTVLSTGTANRVDEEGFTALMNEQKKRARDARASINGVSWVEDNLSVLGDTKTKFVGYNRMDSASKVLAILKDGELSNDIEEGEEGVIILDSTPFYAEMGGQVGDTGVIVSEYETIEIIDTKKENGLPVHIAKKLPEHPEAPMMACVDTDKRHACEANHTATHLLDEALREVLGTHVEQKGSLVSPEGLRFDFSHFQKVTDEEIRQVERLVNEKIREDLPLIEHRDTPIEEAKKLGAIALFGEKYGDKVRVIQFGPSVEFCGGIHAKATGCIGMFKILTESSTAAGVRRIEAVTGQAVEEMLYGMQDSANALKSILPGQNLQAAAQKLIDENASLKKQVEEFMKEKTAKIKNELLSQKKEINGVTVISCSINADAGTARDLAFMLRGEITSNLLVVIGSVDGGKPMLTVSVSDDLTSRFNAGQLVRDAAKHIQGGGGGQPHFATAGGRNADGIQAAIDSILAKI